MSFYPITVNTPATEEAHIFAEDDAAIYQSIFGDDCVFDIGSCLKATVLSNNKVRVGDGVLAMGGHIGRNKYGDYEDLTILNGTSGQKRNDLIVARFATTGVGGVDTFTLAVKQGTPGTVAEDPAVTLGNLYEGASLREFPLYRVKLEGLSITAVEQLFKVRKTNGQLEDEIAELNRKSLIEREITGTTTDYGNLQLGINPDVYNVLYAKSKVGAIAIPYIVSNGTDWAVNIRAAGSFVAQSNFKTTVVVGIAEK